MYEQGGLLAGPQWVGASKMLCRDRLERLEHKDGDLAVSLVLVLRVRAIDSDSAIPPVHPFVVIGKPGAVSLLHVSVLESDFRVCDQVVVPGRVYGVAP